MGRKRLFGAAALVLAGSLALGACGTPAKKADTDSSTTAEKTSLSVMWNQPFYSYNNSTSFGNATANTNIIYMTNDSLTYYDKDLKLQPNKSFGSYEKVSDDPLTVKVTIADTATWSDGTPVTAADLILNHGAVSGLYNTLTGDAADALYNEDGSMKESTGSDVYFDASSASWSLIKEFPEISDDSKTVTYKYTKPFADWEYNLIGAGLPAHIVAKRALGEADATKGAQAIIDAFKNKDNAALAKIANVWNSDWNYSEMPTDKDLVVGTGPYVISDFKKDQYISVAKNANYKGEHVPSIDTVTVRFNEDPMAGVSALKNNEVQIIQPQATADVLKAVQAIDTVNVQTGDEGTYEHVDLTYNNNGPFDPKTYGGDAAKAQKVRSAFLSCIPRVKIVNDIIKPLNPQAEVRQSFNVVPGSASYAATIAANGMSTMYADVDVEKAKTLLADAGAKNVKVRLLYAQANQRRIKEYQLIKESCAAAGITVVDNGNPDWGKKLGDKTYDASLFGWQSTSTAVTESDANYRTGGLNNFGGFSSTKVDALYDELQTTTDVARQVEINNEIEKILVDDAFGITIFQFPGITSWSKTVENVSALKLSPTIFWNFWEWKLAA